MKLIKFLFVVLCFALLFYLVDPEKLWQAFSSLSPELIVILLLISFVLIAVSTVKWQLLLKFSGQEEKFLKLFNLYVLGYFVNSFAPSFLGGDAARSYYVSKKNERATAFSATFLERLSGFFAMVVLALINFSFLPEFSWKLLLLLLFFLCSLVFLVVLLVSKKPLALIGKVKFLQKYQNFFAVFQDKIMSSLKGRKLIVQTLLLSFVFHLITVLNTYVCGLAVGWDSIPVVELFVVLPIILLLSAIPLAPSGLGIQEGAFYFFLTQIGASSEQALGIALILRAKAIILAVLGGLIFLRKSQSKEAT